MTLKDNFCPSPWFHMRITENGEYSYCRWATKNNSLTENNIINIYPKDFFQNSMSTVRKKFLSGEFPEECFRCREMENHGKISGRQKQLLKIGVRLDFFEKSLSSSPWFNVLGSDKFTQYPQDWQIDLGNYCNSACVFCTPRSSSRLASEWKKLGFISKLPPSNWSDDTVLVEKFLDTLSMSPHVKYIHFIGGETILTPSFKTILIKLIKLGFNKTCTIGFTTNLTVWDSDIVELLSEFDGLNLGVSIESFDAINDYARYPSKISVVLENLNKWQQVAKKYNWLLQFRITPTILTIGSLLSMYQYAWDNNITIESCNFLSDPPFMRPTVLPINYRKNIIDEMKQWVKDQDLHYENIVNIRDPNTAKQQIVQDLTSYINYLDTGEDESYMLPQLVKFLKKLESNRNNNILEYLPEYEDLFRSAGY